jgi:cytoskeletal protein RodZ
VGLGYVEAEQLVLLRRIVAALENQSAVNTQLLSMISGISDTLDTFLADWLAANTEAGAASAVLGLNVGGESTMSLTVDQSGNATLAFEDDKGDVTGPPPGDGSGLVVVIGSDNGAVATVGPTDSATDSAGNGNYVATVTPVAEGTFNLTASVANSSGAPLTDADGTTAFTQPANLEVTILAGQAAGAALSIAPATSAPSS